MKKISSRFRAVLCMTLAVCIILSSISVQVFAATDGVIPANAITVEKLINSVVVKVAGNSLQELSLNKNVWRNEKDLVVSWDSPSKVLYAKFNDGTVSAGMDMTPQLPIETELKPSTLLWTANDVFITGYGSTSPYLIDRYTYTVTGNGSTTPERAMDANGTTVITQEGIWDVDVYAYGNDQTKSLARRIHTQLDRTKPVVIWEETSGSAVGVFTLEISASDAISGYDYTLLPNGTKETKPKFTWETDESGYYTFVVFDKAGNKVTRTYDLRNLREEYAVQDFHIINEPSLGGPVNVSATFSCSGGAGVNVPVQIKDADSGKVYLQDTINIGKGTSITKEFAVKMEGIKPSRGLTVTINPSKMNDEPEPGDNSKTVRFNMSPFDFSIEGFRAESTFVKPSSDFKMVTSVKSTGLNDTRQILVEWLVNNKVVDTQEVSLGGSVNDKRLESLLPSPAVVGPFEVTARVNYGGMSAEENTTNNISKVTMEVVNANLGVKVNDLDIVDGNTYGYSSSSDKGTFNFVTAEPKEKIKYIIFNEEEIKVNNSTYALTIKGFEIKDKKPVDVCVVSADGKQERIYHIYISKFNSNVDLEVEYGATSKEKTEVKLSPSNSKMQGSVEIGSSAVEIVLETNDEDSKIVSIDSAPYNQAIKNKAKITKNFVSGAARVVVVVQSQDGEVQQEYTLEFSNTNSEVKVTVVNAEELAPLGVGTIYGKSGILRNNTFIHYGDGITNVAQAKKEGVTGGIILQLEVEDANKNQKLDGVVTLGGKDYPVYWNSFAGKRQETVKKIKFGYAYIRITDAMPNGSNILADIKVSDYEDESTTAISTTSKKIYVNIDTIAPIITTTTEDGNAGAKRVVVMVDGSSDLSGKEVTYEISKDGGRTWSDTKKVSGNSVEVTGNGELQIKITATDKIGNVRTAVATVVVGSGDGGEADTAVAMRKTRLADYYFIGTSQEGEATLIPGNFDF